MNQDVRGKSSSFVGHGASEQQHDTPESISATPPCHGRTIRSVCPPPRGPDTTEWHDKGKAIFSPVEVDRSGPGPYPWSSAADKLLNVNNKSRDDSRKREAPQDICEDVADEECALSPRDGYTYPTSNTRASTLPPGLHAGCDDHVPITEGGRKRVKLIVRGPDPTQENQRVNAAAGTSPKKRKAQLPITTNPHEEKRLREDEDSGGEALRALEAGVARYFRTKKIAPRPAPRRTSSPPDDTLGYDDDDAASDDSAYPYPDSLPSEADYDTDFSDNDTEYDYDYGEYDYETPGRNDPPRLEWPKALSNDPRDRLRLYKPVVPTSLNPARATTLTPLEIRHAYALAFRHKHPLMTSAYTRPAFIERHRSDCDNGLCVPWNAVLRSDQEPRAQRRCRACFQGHGQPRTIWQTKASKRYRAQLTTSNLLERLFQEMHERERKTRIYDDGDYGVDYSEAYE